MKALVGILLALIGPTLGAFYWFVSRASEKRKTAFGLIEQYNSSEMFVVRAVAWRARQSWYRGDHSILDFFLVSDGPAPTPKDCSNGLTVDQNLAWFLHFFGNLAQYESTGLVNTKLIQLFFEPHYRTYRQFFADFTAEFEAHAAADQPRPSWISNLRHLEEIFASARQRKGRG